MQRVQKHRGTNISAENATRDVSINKPKLLQIVGSEESAGNATRKKT